MTSDSSKSLVWFRRDLRVDDHAALHHALRGSAQVWCVFVFDTDILAPLRARGLVRDRRVEFIQASLIELDAVLRARGGGLIVRHGRAVDEIPAVAAALGVQAVWINHDDEPAALARDAEVRRRLEAEGRRLHDGKDQVILERDEVLTGQGGAFSVFTPYKNAWLKRVTEQDLASWPSETHLDRLAPLPAALDAGVPALETLGFAPSNLGALAIVPGMTGARAAFDDFLQRIGRYGEQRDFPAVRGVSYLSVHLRFGTISIRRLAREAHARMREEQAAGTLGGATIWLSELIWREFYMMILYRHPRLAGGAAFKPVYDRIEWVDGAAGDALFEAWCEGRTGYPLVDAAMAQLNQTGYMHNRLRMVTASFLVKDLGIDWRRGEQVFAERLNDFDFAANNGGWQWAASSGCDAQPYFRIFNPITQSEKFDPAGKFIRRYLPQLAPLPDKAIHAPWLASASTLASAGLRLGTDYPHPVVMHDQARAQTLARYAVVKT